MLNSPSGAGASDFGYSVSIYGDTAVVGDHGWGDRGSAYVFYRDQGGLDNWGFVKELSGAALIGDEFGFSVSIYKDLVLVGAPKHNDGGSSRGCPDFGARCLWDR